MIDYDKIAYAESFFNLSGYKRIDVPWLVKRENVDITRPSEAKSFDTFAGSLVASGEQSFLEIRETLKKGKYQCTTPCFRDDEVDDLHQKWFMKVELIEVVERGNIGDKCYSDIFRKLRSTVALAHSFFEHFHPKSISVKYFPSSMDIMINGIEVGSYGYREHNGFCWIYGTACAEPRLSKALKGF